MQKLFFEVFWLLLSLVLVILVLYPIYQNAIDYIFYVNNAACVFAFVTFLRYIFLMPKTFYLFRKKWNKAILFFLCIPIFFYLMEGLMVFQIYNDDIGLQEFFKHKSLEDQNKLMIYLRNETFFFGVGALMLTVILPFKLIRETWRDFKIKQA